MDQHNGPILKRILDPLCYTLKEQQAHCIDVVWLGFQPYFALSSAHSALLTFFMSIPTTPYSEFQTIRNTLADQNGPWRVAKSSYDLTCPSSLEGNSDGICRVYGCLICFSGLTPKPLSFNVNHTATIFFPISQFGNTDNLDFTFTYNYYYAAKETPPGTTQTVRVTVGSWSGLVNFGSLNLTGPYLNEPLVEPFIHSGTTSVTKSPDGTNGYLPITVDFSFTRVTMWDEFRLSFIGHTFSLKPSASLPPASGSTTSSATSASSGLSTASRTANPSTSSAFPGSISPDPSSSSIAVGDPAVGFNDGMTGSSRPSNGRALEAGIIGGALGGLALCAGLAFLLFLVYKRKRKGWQKQEEEGQVYPAMFGANFETDIGRTGGKRSGERGQMWIRPAKTKARLGLLHHSLASRAPAERIQPAEEGRRRRGRNNEQNRQMDGDRRRRRRRRRLALADPASFNHEVDVPPPAYSDNNAMAEASNGYDREEQQEQEQEQDGSGLVDGRAETKAQT